MMRGGGVPDADAAAQEHRLPQASTTHVANLGDLIHHLTKCIVDEVDEHEVDNRAGAGHGGTAGESDEAALANWCVAETLRSVFGKQAGGGAKVAAAHADAFAEHEDLRMSGHFSIERLEGGADQGEFTHARSGGELNG